MLQADDNNHVHVRMHRTPPLYPPHIWNVHEATVRMLQALITSVME